MDTSIEHNSIENSPITSSKLRLAVFVAFSGQGGVERMVLNLLEGFAAQGLAIDLLITRPPASSDRLPEQVRLVPLGTRHTHLALPALVRYLQTEQPTAMLVAKDRAIRTAVRARRLAGVDTRIVGRLGTHLSASLAHRSALTRWLRTWPMRRLYQSVDQIIAVSQGVADDTREVTGLPADRVRVIRNPTITPALFRLAEHCPEHPWLTQPTEPVIVGAGRLTLQKDFTTLLQAFARLHQQRPAKLIILGEGEERQVLERTARDLGIAEHVSFPGFQTNPYGYLARADLFVLSSRWEGSPNVLTEALALGTPVVATDCPSGPAEVLDQGRYGALVPVGDSQALAQAMRETLNRPLPAEQLRQAVQEYTMETSAQHYLSALGLTPRAR